MKLLLISSEQLNPDNILTSTFELTQAVLLQQIASVAILSVSPPRTLPEETRQWASGRKATPAYASFLKTLLLKRGPVNRYLIEGVPVYEGRNYNYYTKRNWEGELRNWTVAGYVAFLRYVDEHGYPDFVHAHGRFINAGFLAVEILRRKNIPFFYTEHSTVYQTNTAPPAARAVLDNIIRKATGVFAVSGALRKQMQVFLGKVLPEVIVCPNVLDPVFEESIPELKSTPAVNLICVASLHKKKGLEVLIQAFDRAFHSDERYHLTICGEGPLRQELEIMVSVRGLSEKIIFTGNLSKLEIRRRIDLSHILVLSSFQETFGVAVIEALARGCPVIATRSGGPEEILTEQDGMLVDAGSAAAMADAIRQMTQSYYNYDRDRIREHAIVRYGSSAFLARARELYRERRA